MTTHNRYGKFTKKETKISRPTFQAVLHEYNFERIADRVYGTMSEPITMITTT